MSMNEHYIYQVEIDGKQTELVSPLPLLGLNEIDVYPVKLWNDESGGIACVDFKMGNGDVWRVINHPFQYVQPPEDAE